MAIPFGARVLYVNHSGHYGTRCQLCCAIYIVKNLVSL